MSTDASGRRAIDLSFEFFPPKTPDMEQRLWQAIQALAPLKPRFVSVTYGAGGTTRDRTHATVARIRATTALEPAAHLTCVGATRAEIDAIAVRYWRAGVRHIVALRGDPPEGLGERYTPFPGGYAYAAELVEGLRRINDFDISVAAFPETHPEAASADADLDNLKRKIDAGACRAITQYFFDPDIFFRFRDRARARRITVPIVPGLLPIANFRQTCSFSERCGTTVPAGLRRRFEGLDADPKARHAAAVETAAAMAAALIEGGVGALHVYTLNRAELTRDICAAVGIVAQEPAAPLASAVGA
ncbi:MAG: methylenetetrahydrofolate reductase [NAD(P)H] [Alphaproteobacteria bacterium]|nr:methylenetetrahydrofolate reductase [NAD(P)H] [Alphaproteobacteria bacterium]